MVKNYIKIAWRNLVKNKASSFINIGGLAVGMAVAMLIGLWIYDELNFNKYHKNYNRIAKVMMTQTVNGTASTSEWTALPLRTALKNDYSSDFSYAALIKPTGERVLSYGNNKFTKSGNFAEPAFAEMLQLKMQKGILTGLKDPGAVFLSKSLANTLFGGTDPMNNILKVDNKLNVKVAGIYEDFPDNSEFKDVQFILPWQQLINDQEWVRRVENIWSVNAFTLLVQIGPNTTIDGVSKKIANVKAVHSKDEAKFSPKIFLHPMSRWHLYSEWENGVPVRGRIQFVFLFGIIGAFVLLLACINFMNLSTARSEKRAKEVGIRKAIGSVRKQLISQFFTESLLVASFAFVLSILIVQLTLPFFNDLADKKMTLLWSNPLFWLVGICFSLFTGIIAGSYPALYLSSFQPIKVLKGTFKVGRFASMPRKFLVVLQFTVSIALIIGTIVVFRQIQYAQNRPIGYEQKGLLNVRTNTPEIIEHYNVIQDELLKSGSVISMSESSTPTTGSFSSDTRFDWKGKDPNLSADFDVVACTHDYGKTIGWQIKEGRDFSRAYPTDSFAVVLNETAVKFMGLKIPVGENIKWGNDNFTVIGVIKDMVMNSPFEAVKQTVFKLNYDWVNFITMKLNPQMNVSEAINKIGTIFRKYNTASPFEYKFLDDEYAKKFSQEERIGKLSGFFAILAIFISCLGLFGLASFVAEQRTKEIGIRKVLGASVANLWQMLSKDFVALVIISCLIATPIAYYFMYYWLQNYQYHTELSWWIFAAAGVGALIITLITISFQAIKTATANPVKNLRTE